MRDALFAEGDTGLGPDIALPRRILESTTEIFCSTIFLFGEGVLSRFSNTIVSTLFILASLYNLYSRNAKI